jgi:hypothetical protein
MTRTSRRKVRKGGERLTKMDQSKQILNVVESLLECTELTTENLHCLGSWIARRLHSFSQPLSDLNRRAEDARAILDHSISAIAESPHDHRSPDDKDCEARSLTMIGAVKNELRQESPLIASVRERAVTSVYAKADGCWERWRRARRDNKPIKSCWS